MVARNTLIGHGKASTRIAEKDCLFCVSYKRKSGCKNSSLVDPSRVGSVKPEPRDGHNLLGIGALLILLAMGVNRA